MSNLLNISSEKLSDENLGEVLRAYLIGAQARDIQLLHHGLTPFRATRDVDIAMMISNLQRYKIVKAALVKHGDFKPYGSEPYRLIHGKTKIVLDLLPFGGIAKAGTVRFDDRFKTKLPVSGIKEVYQVSQPVQIDNAIRLNVATLAGVFLLKLLAWYGAPESRTKDVDDLKYIVQHYFDFSEDEIYEKHLDLFVEDFVPEKVAARVLGRHLQPILKQSTRLRKKSLGDSQRKCI